MSTQPNWGPDRPCITCEHFGGWPAGRNGPVWCLDGKSMHALTQKGCAYWAEQQEWWVMPPDPGPTPGAVINASTRASLPRMR